MPTPLSWHVDEVGTSRVVTVRGDLDRAAVPGLRLALMKVLAEQPAGVLVDVAALTVADYVNLSLFAAVMRQAGRWPGIPVLLCAPSPRLAEMLSRGAYRRLPVVCSVAAGVDAVDTARAVPPAIADVLLPIQGAARHARDMATDACSRWDLPHLLWPASLVATELVSNAVQHARTMLTLRFAHRSRYLLISVEDGSLEQPLLRTPPPGAPVGGRGLLLVETLSARWGSLPTATGKVVWATLRTMPPPA